MIYLEKGQKVKDRADLVVYDQTGERNDTDMVICAKIESPEEPFCWLEAQYIEYGGLVYTINDEKELEKEILKFDPNTTINDIVGNPVQSQQQIVEPAPQLQQEAAPAQVVPSEQPQVPSEPVAPAAPASAPIENNTNASSTPPIESGPVEPVVAPPVGEAVSSQVVEPVVEPVSQPVVETVQPQAPAPVEIPVETPTETPVETPATTEQIVSINTRRRIRKIIV